MLRCTDKYEVRKLLAETAYPDYNDYDYYAFADQDDIWLDFKLSNAVKMMDAYDCRNNNGKLYVSDRQLVNSQLEIIPEPETRKKTLTLEEAILSQPFLGSTTVFDYILLDQFLTSPSEVMTLHDEWIYEVALMTGTKYTKMIPKYYCIDNMEIMLSAAIRSLCQNGNADSYISHIIDVLIN